MKNPTNRSTVLVIHGTNHRYDYESVKEWFADSDFMACEALDLFDAIDKLSDFTSLVCPDVFLVKVEPGSQEDKMICQFDPALEEVEVPIAVLSDIRGAHEKLAFNFGSLRGLMARLDHPSPGPA